MSPMTIDEIVAAINETGVTAGELTAILGRSSILVDVEAKRAEVSRKTDQISTCEQLRVTEIDAKIAQRDAEVQAIAATRDAELATLRAELAVLEQELAALQAQANELL